MNMKITFIFALGLFILNISAAQAQLSNKPLQFRNSVDGLGMSMAGKQAIMNDKIYGIQPQNLLRDSSGSLLTVEKGRGSVPIVRYDGTNEIIVGYKGTSFFSDNFAMKNNVFNSFFTADGNSGSSAIHYAAISSYPAIDTWTKRIAVEGLPMAFVDSSYDTIDSWTGQAYVLSSD